MRVAICDDDKYLVENLYIKISKLLNKWNYEYEIFCFYTGLDMLVDIDIRGIYDIIFLDIELGKADGISIAKKLRDEYHVFTLIFISQYEEYYRDVFEVDAKWFLDKPFSDERLEKALKKAVFEISSSKDIFEFCFKKSMYRLVLKDIVYIESDRRKLLIHCNDNRIYEYYEKLCTLEEHFNQSNVKFIRVNQSYLVNTSYIKRYCYEDVELYNGEKFIISQGRREKIREIFLDRNF